MVQISVLEGDITKVDCDAIVNAANTTLLGGGGVDGAIHRAAGPELLAQCRVLGGCPTGKAKITAGYELCARFCIHTPGPIWHGGDRGEAELLAGCYKSSLELAAANDCKRVAFPSISTGVYRYPLALAAAVAIFAIVEYFEQNPNAGIEEVLMVCFDPHTKSAYEEALHNAKLLMLY